MNLNFNLNINKEQTANYALIVSAAIYLTFPMTKGVLLSYGIYEVVLILPGVMLLAYLASIFYRSRRSVISIDDALILILIVGLLISATYSFSTRLTGAVGLVFLMGLSYAVGAYLSVMRSRLFFELLLLITLPVMVAIFIELEEFNYVYTQFVKNSESAYTVSYIQSSMFAVISILMLPVFRLHWIYKLPLYIALIAFVAVSSAKFSVAFLSMYIVFAVVATIYTSSSRKNSLLFIGVVVIGLLLYFYFDDVVPFVENTIARFENFVQSKKSRVVLLDQSFLLVAQKPFLGHGLGTSVEMLSENSYPHNFLLQAWLESGLYTLIPLIFITLRGVLLTVSTFRFGALRSSAGFAYIFIVLSFLKSINFLEAQIMFFFYGYLVHAPRERRLENG